MAGIKQVSFTSPYSAEEMAIERRKKLAEMLATEANKPLGTQMLGRVAIQNSPLEGLAKVAKAGASAYLGNKSEEMQKELGERARSERTQALARAMQMMQGSPGSPMPPDEQGGGPALPAQAPDQMGAIQALAQSNDPMLQQAGMGGILQSFKPRQPQVIGEGGVLLGPDNRPIYENKKDFKPDKPADAWGEPYQMGGVWVQKNSANGQIKTAVTREPQTRITLPRPEQPLVAIIGPDGKPIMVRREDAIGKTPAGAGSKAEAVAAGKTDVDRDIVTLKSSLDALKEGGGITSTTKGTADNVRRWASTTGPGQLLGSMGGTHNQKARDVISQARPLLLRSIMNATGMSARQLDSNAELKLWLSTATDPTKGYEANVEALNNIASKYGSGPIIDGGQQSTGKITRSFKTEAEAIKSGVKGEVIINGRKARID